MLPDTWERIKEIVAEALEIDPSEREHFVREAAGKDHEVLLVVLPFVEGASHIDSSFLEPLPWKAAELLPWEEIFQPSFSVGQTVCDRFEIVRYIASGGMGDVFEAWDAELKEAVALKTIRRLVTLATQAAESFRNEVRQARRIPHANVCNIHDLFCHRSIEGGETWFLSMELLMGETLAERLRQSGPLSKAEATSILRDLAAGLAAAHNLQIIHRDLKPGNIMLVPSPSAGIRAVITDFGVASTLSGGETEGSAAQGTPAYMSPEQAFGRTLGTASDLYALGVVVCEMLTLQRPPAGSDQGWDHKEWVKRLDRKYGLGQPWRQIVLRCLDPDPAKRCGEVAELERMLDAPARARRRWVLWAGAVTGLLAVLGTAIVTRKERIVDAHQITLATDLAGMPSITPDGKMIAYASDAAEPGNLDIWVQSLPDGDPKRLTNDPAQEDDPGISPDGRLVAYSEREGGDLYVVSAATGQKRLLARGGRGGSFSPDGKLIAYWTGNNDDSAGAGKIFVIPPEGGTPRRIAFDFYDARNPIWHLDDGMMLFQGCRTSSLSVPLAQCEEWWATSTDGTVLKATGALQRIRAANIEPHHAANVWRGNDIFFGGRLGSSSSIWKIRLTNRTLVVTGNPVKVSGSLSAEIDEVSPAVSSGQVLAYEHQLGAIHIYGLPLTYNRGDSVRATTRVATDSSVSISSDGKTLVFARRESGSRNLWEMDIASGKEEMLFHGDGDVYWPILDPASRQVVFEIRGGSSPGIYVRSKDGSARRVCETCMDPLGWFIGGRLVFYRTATGAVGLLDTQTGYTQVVLSAPDGMTLDDVDWSPSTRRMLFTVTKAGERLKRIYFLPFSANGPLSQEDWTPLHSQPESIDRPRWSVNGAEVFFASRRDGFYCIWKLRADSGGPDRVPEAVYHFHNIRLSPSSVAAPLFSLSVGTDRLYLNVSEISGGIWTGRLTKVLFPW